MQQPPFIEHIMIKVGLETIITEKMNGKRGRGRSGEKIMNSLTQWHD